MTITIKVESVLDIPFLRFMLIASYFLYDIDNIVVAKKKILFKVLLIQDCSYFYDKILFFLLLSVQWI